ncbi:RARG protein, partial [Polyodon spathula]|nr:RARG protein [Polyodon spathula]
MTSFPPAVYPFAFNSIRSHSPFDLLANGSFFGRFGADLQKEMAALYTAAQIHRKWVVPLHSQGGVCVCVELQSPAASLFTISLV